MTEEIKENGKEQPKALAIPNNAISFAEIQGMGDVFFKSGMFADLKSAAQAIVKIQAGRELGLGPVYSMQRLYMVDGKLGMSAETMAALLKKSGKYNYRVKEHTDQKCSIVFYENGKEVYISTFTMEDAKRARLLKPGSSWEKYPRALLFSRSLSQGTRIVGPDSSVGGAYTQEELESITIEDAPITEGVNQAPTQIEQASEAIVDSDNPYAHFLDMCPEHGDSWRINKFGKRSHKQGDDWCNFSEQIKVILKPRAEQARLTASEVNDWCKENHDGRTWSKLSEEEQLEALWALDKMATPKENPLVAEIKKQGGVEE